MLLLRISLNLEISRLSRISRSNLELLDVSMLVVHFSKHTISESDFTILTSSNSKFDLEMSESLLISNSNYGLGAFFTVPVVCMA